MREREIGERKRETHGDAREAGVAGEGGGEAGLDGVEVVDAPPEADDGDDVAVELRPVEEPPRGAHRLLRLLRRLRGGGADAHGVDGEGPTVSESFQGHRRVPGFQN